MDEIRRRLQEDAENMKKDMLAYMHQRIYTLLSEEPEEYIKAKVDNEVKITVIDRMLAKYEDSEDYEKCTNLLKVKERILKDARKN